MIATYEILKNSLANYKAPEIKIKRMSDRGEIIKITKNLYETDKETPGFLVANAIYGPSYLSFDYALAYYGLIPEAVYVYTSATFKQGKKKEYKNPLGILLIGMFRLKFIHMVSKLLEMVNTVMQLLLLKKLFWISSIPKKQ